MKLIIEVPRIMPAREQPCWVCGLCGDSYGMLPVRLATWHDGDHCDVCGADASTTEARDFGYLTPEWLTHRQRNKRPDQPALPVIDVLL